MDLDAELERLSREARQKLDAERGPAAEHTPEATPAGDALEGEAVAEARRLAARPEGAMSLGGKVAVALVGLVAAAIVWSLVIAPLLKLAFVVAIVVGLVWLVIKLMDDDDGDGDDDDEPRGGGSAP